RAEVARDILPRMLRARGAEVTIATVYRTLKPGSLPGDLRKRLLHGEIDAVTFTSSSTVDGFMRHFTAREKQRLFRHTRAAAIGPITSATLKSHGISSVIQAKRYTIEALAKALVNH